MPRRDHADRRPKQLVTPDAVAKRTRRHLDELERTNYAATYEPDSDGEASSSKFRARQTVISDKRATGKKKKSTMNVRTAILYRKSLAALIDESGIVASQPTYLTAAAPASTVPPRMLCSVCGYKGSYRCQKCGMSYCDLRCGQVHGETRCERRVL